MFWIFAINWSFNNFNKFENNFLMFTITLNLNNVTFVIKTLKNFEIFDYNFIDEDFARFVYKKLKFTFVFFFKLKHFCCFDDRMIKSIIYVIYFTLIVKNHRKFIVFMFIIKINNHFLIFDKFWFNKHNVIFDFMNDFIHFKLKRCIHWNFSR